MGASKPVIEVPKGLQRSSIVFETIPVTCGSAPVAITMCETAVRAGVGGTDRPAMTPRAAIRR